MVSRPDMLDHINRLRDYLHLVALAALSLDDSDNANAIHLGISEAQAVADEMKAMLMAETGLGSTTLKDVRP